MGAFLATPVTEKISENAENEDLICGGSSMQGWRSTQEDAHNCVLNFDKETSLFAVYDGHGGADVAIYSSLHLPDAIKQTESYAKGDYSQALKDAFLEFDATLITDKVVKELEKIAQKHNGEAEDNENEDEDDEESVNDLYKEASMPLADVMARYRNPSLQGKLPASPFLRAKKDDPGASSSSADAGCSSSSNVSNSESEVSSSSGGASSSKSESKNNVEAASSSGSGSGAGPSSSSSAPSSSSHAKEVSNSAPDSSSCNNIASEASSSSKKETAEKVMVNGIAHGASGDSVSSSQNSKGSKMEAESECQGSGDAGKSAKSSNDDTISSSDSPSGKSPHKKRVVPTRVGSTKLYEKLLTQGNGVDSSESDEEDDPAFPGAAADSDDDDDDDEGALDEDEEDDLEDDSDELEDEDEEDSDDDEDLEDDDDDGFCGKEKVGEDSGCTAVVALIHKDTLYVANAGDSRCVVSRNREAVEMSFDHKPEDPPEKTRIVNAGGKVTPDGRVNGGLNLSRALGDHSYKQNKSLGPTEQMISALPDIKTLDIDRSRDEFMVLACDGIWNSMSSQEVVDFINERLDKGVKKLTDISEELFDRCLAPNTIGDGTGCDNMTCIIVRWKKPGETNGINSGSANETKVAQEAEQKKPTESTEASTVSPATKTEAEKRCASPDTDDTSRKRSKIDEEPSD
ncbi:protein phosphatase 1G isoform X3 [Bemisia tabaci]|uniref:protein phosphatase 1G isoform X3 n=1 Tax=Bemisia tabaci TaxID=7038 RepID=UPI003B283608